MTRFRKWLIQLLGGFTEAPPQKIEERKEEEKETDDYVSRHGRDPLDGYSLKEFSARVVVDEKDEDFRSIGYDDYMQYIRETLAAKILDNKGPLADYIVIESKAIPKQPGCMSYRGILKIGLKKEEVTA